jgi:hypothetical protein
MDQNDVVDLAYLASSVPRRIARLDGRQGEDRLPIRGLHMDVGRVVFSGVEVKPVRSAPKDCGHADLADGSTCGDHRGGRFTATYVREGFVHAATLAWHGVQ